MKNNLLPLVFVSNKDFLPHLSTSILSIAKNNLDSFIKFYILNFDLSKKDFNKLEKSIKFHKSFSLINCRCKNKTLSKIKMKVGHINETAFLKFLIEDFVHEEKVIYIDADTIILKSLRPLISIKLNGFCIAAVEEDIYTDNEKEKVGIKKNIKTFNSGIFVIDLYKWKKRKIKQNCIEHLKKYKRDLYFLDQDSLNSVISGNFQSLDSSFNQRQNPTVVHFSGYEKPWHFDSNHIYKNHYWKFRNQTFFRKNINHYFDLFRIFKIFIKEIPIRYFFILGSKLKNFYKSIFSIFMK